MNTVDHTMSHRKTSRRFIWPMIFFVAIHCSTGFSDGSWTHAGSPFYNRPTGPTIGDGEQNLGTTKGLDGLGSGNSEKKAKDYEAKAKTAQACGQTQKAKQLQDKADKERQQSKIFLALAVGLGAAGLAVGIAALSQGQKNNNVESSVVPPISPITAAIPPTQASTAMMSPVALAKSLQAELGGSNSSAPQPAVGIVATQSVSGTLVQQPVAGVAAPQFVGGAGVPGAALTAASYAEATGQLVEMPEESVPSRP
jgi:hypothetical protein